MTDKFTPGPYYVDADGDISLAYGDGWTLAFTIDADDCQPVDMNGPPFTQEELDATRKLLASAPNLLADLREIVKMVIRSKFSSNPADLAASLNEIEGLAASRNYWKGES